MGKNLDGVQKNLSRVREGFDAAKKEWVETPAKLKLAIKDKDFIRVVHHLSDFRGAGTEHLWKLHFYLFWPKWVAVGILIWAI